MTSLEIITIGGNKMFSRANMTRLENEIVFELQNSLNTMVRNIKLSTPKKDQKEEADKVVNFLINTFAPKLGNTTIESQIRELARHIWTRLP